MRVRHLTAANYRIMPWANGRGQTVELLRVEDEAGALQVRLSVADVVEAGDFSRLAGIDRVLTLIEGDGFDLDFAGAAPSVTALPFKPIAFSGDWATSASNLRGPSRDFNVMTARGSYDVEVSRTASAAIAQDELICLYVVDGSADVTMSTVDDQNARYCEERSDAAIQKAAAKGLDGVAASAMTAVEERAEICLRAQDLLIIDGSSQIDIRTAGDVLAVRLHASSLR